MRRVLIPNPSCLFLLIVKWEKKDISYIVHIENRKQDENSPCMTPKLNGKVERMTIRKK
jgi:hypothetical protein